MESCRTVDHGCRHNSIGKMSSAYAYAYMRLQNVYQRKYESQSYTQHAHEIVSIKREENRGQNLQRIHHAVRYSTHKKQLKRWINCTTVV